MNKKIMKLAVAAITCVALTGTTLAAPARQHQKAPAPKPVKHNTPKVPHVTPAHHVVHHPLARHVEVIAVDKLDHVRE